MALITFRNMVREDIPSGLSLCRATGWNQLTNDWELFLHLSPKACRVAVDESGVVMGTVTTVRYDNHFSWIGMLLVNPALQRQGIGMRLLEESVQILKEEQTIKLDATPAGREVYLKFNFKEEYTISRMLLSQNVKSNLPDSMARPISESDFQKLLLMDQEVFGAIRKTVLEWAWTSTPEFAFIVEIENKILGYCFGRRGYLYTHIGPIVAQDVEVAIQLVSAALNQSKNQSVILDIPSASPAWTNYLTSIGFEEQRLLTRMYKGLNEWPGVSEKQFAILGPEFG